MTEEIISLYRELQDADCVLQYVRSGRIAITKSCVERISEYMSDREEKYHKCKFDLQ